MVEQKKFASEQPLASAQQAFPTKVNAALNAAVPIDSGNFIVSATPFKKVSEETTIIQLAPEPILTAKPVSVSAPVITTERLPIAQTQVQQTQFQASFAQPLQQMQQSLPMKKSLPIQEKKIASAEIKAPKLNIVAINKPTISEAVELVEREMGIEKQTFQLPETLETSLPESISLKPVQLAEEAVSSLAEKSAEAATTVASAASTIFEESKEVAANVSEAALSATAKGVEAASNMASSVASTASTLFEESKEVASNIASNVSEAAFSASAKGVEVASNVASSVASAASTVYEGSKEVAANVGTGIAQAASNVYEESKEVAANVAHKTAEVASEAAHKGAELAADVGVGVASVASRTAELASETGMIERGKEMVSAAAHMGVEAAEAVVHMGSQVMSAAAHMGSQLLSNAFEMMAPSVVEEADILEKEYSEELILEKDLQWVYPQIFSPAFMQAVIDISPIEFETDFRGLELDIKAHSKAGLWWGRSEQPDVAFGIRRLRMVCIFDSRTWSLSAIEEWFDVELKERIQGIEFVGVNRLGKL